MSVIATRVYDNGGRLTQITHGNSLVTTHSYHTGHNLLDTIGNTAVGNYGYTWDANHNKTAETITGAMSGRSFTATYDDEDRLIEWDRTNGDNQQWLLTPVHDWEEWTKNTVVQQRTHGPAHEILAVGSTLLTHDPKGNLTEDQQSIEYTWDADNMLAAATVPATTKTGLPGTHTYEYDALGRRVAKTISDATDPLNIVSTTTVFAYDDQQILADYAGGAVASSPIAGYVWAGYVDELIAKVTGSTKVFYHVNQQYSTVAVTDALGAVTLRVDYTSYGELTFWNAAGTSTIAPTTVDHRYTFTGREYDREIASLCFRARPYAAGLGRFFSRDMLGYDDGAQIYAAYFVPHGTDPDGNEVMIPRPAPRPKPPIRGPKPAPKRIPTPVPKPAPRPIPPPPRPVPAPSGGWIGRCFGYFVGPVLIILCDPTPTGCGADRMPWDPPMPKPWPDPLPKTRPPKKPRPQPGCPHPCPPPIVSVDRVPKSDPHFLVPVITGISSSMTSFRRRPVHASLVRGNWEGVCNQAIIHRLWHGLDSRNE